MEVSIEGKKPPVKGIYTDDDMLIATTFAKKIQKDLPKLVKAIVLFGSFARQKERGSNYDIDVLLVIDDVRVVLTDELMATYKLIIDGHMADTSKRLHVITLKLTTLWEYTRAGDPIIINVLRDGFPLIDFGFFEPMQALLYRGKIRPTHESIAAYYNKAPMTLSNASYHVNQAIVDLYWAVIDSAHAALMSQGYIPPSPKHVPDLLNQLVKQGKLSSKYVKIAREMYKIMKKITHREVNAISGKHYDTYRKNAEAFVKQMETFVRK